MLKTRGRYVSLKEITASPEGIFAMTDVGPYKLELEVLDDSHYAVYATRIFRGNDKLALSFYTDQSGWIHCHYGPGRASDLDPASSPTSP